MNRKKDLLNNWKANESHIREVLMSHWDPIGVHDVPEAQDEYDSYIGPLYTLIEKGASDKNIAEKLLSIELGDMGVGRGISVEDLIPVAKQLREVFKTLS